jgi:hypothetical protein
MTETAAPVPEPDYTQGQPAEDHDAVSQDSSSWENFTSGEHDPNAPEPATPTTASSPLESQVGQLEQSDPQLIQELQQEDQVAQEYAQSDPQVAQEITQEEQVQLEEADPQLATEMIVEAATTQDGGNGTPPVDPSTPSTPSPQSEGSTGENPPEPPNPPDAPTTTPPTAPSNS